MSYLNLNFNLQDWSGQQESEILSQLQSLAAAPEMYLKSEAGVDFSCLFWCLIQV